MLQDSKGRCPHPSKNRCRINIPIIASEYTKAISSQYPNVSWVIIGGLKFQSYKRNSITMGRVQLWLLALQLSLVPYVRQTSSLQVPNMLRFVLIQSTKKNILNEIDYCFPLNHISFIWYNAWLKYAIIDVVSSC